VWSSISSRKRKNSILFSVHSKNGKVSGGDAIFNIALMAHKCNVKGSDTHRLMAGLTMVFTEDIGYLPFIKFQSTLDQGDLINLVQVAHQKKLLSTPQESGLSNKKHGQCFRRKNLSIS
jgi:hypothetical protein